jgi:glutaredoxin 3
MSRKLTVYTTATCGYCKMLKKYLEDNKINFTEKRVDLNQQDAQEMVAKSGQMGVPFSVITKEDGQEFGVLGFDVASLQRALLS